MNRINALFKKKTRQVLSVYFTAGYPEKESTVPLIEAIADAGADMIEIGIPFSDPLADGAVIQQSNNAALKNGMSLKVLFEQLKTVREKTDVPLILMGYLNPVLQFGFPEFCKAAKNCGIDGLILPDLPIDVYQREYQQTAKSWSLKMIFLITPQTAVERVRLIDQLSDSFIYLVTSAGTTGRKDGFTEADIQYFKDIGNLALSNPLVAGFGIRNKIDFDIICRHVNGGIVGSSFLKTISKEPGTQQSIPAIHQFIKSLIA